MTIPNGQTWLKDYMGELGYKPTEDGICYGVANVGMQAFQLGELELFIDRLDLISEIPLENIKNEIENAKEIKKRNKIFSETIQAEASKKIDIIAFFDEIILLHQIHMFPELFKPGKTPVSQNAEASFKLLKPQALQEKGGMKLIDSFSDTYQTADLEIYLKIFREMTEQADFPVSLILTNINHTIHIGFDSNKKSWVVINATYLNSIYIPEAEIKDTLIKAFSKNGIAVFNTSVCVTKNNFEKASELYQEIQLNPDWEKLHEITPEKIELKDSFGASLLHIAAKNGEVGLAKKLIDAGADVNAETTMGHTPLHRAAAKGHIDVVNILLDSDVINVNADSGDGTTPFHMAVIHGYFDIAKALLGKGANIDATLIDGMNAFHLAAYYGFPDIIKFLLKKGVDATKQTMQGLTPLHIAIIKNDINCVTALLEGGVDANVDGRAPPPLYLAAKEGNANIIKALIEKGADINKALMIAIAQKNIQIMETLINNGADLNAIDSNGDTPLHHAVHGSIDVINCLLTHNANPNAVNNEEDTPLLIVAEFIDAEFMDNYYANIFKALLAKGADIDTTLYIAAKKEKSIRFKNLLAFGANINAALYIAAEKGDTNAIKYLLYKNADINIALHMAVQKSNADVIKILVNNGAEINAANPDGDTPLVIAARNNDAIMVKTLMENGASIDKSLYIAAEKYDVIAVKFLLDRVSDINAMLQAAKQNGHGNLARQIYIKMLTNYCAQRDKKQEYKTSFKFFSTEFNFGISKTEEFAAVKMLQEVLEGSKPASSLKDYEAIFNDTDLKPIYDKIREDVKFDNIISVKNVK